MLLEKGKLGEKERVTILGTWSLLLLVRVSPVFDMNIDRGIERKEAKRDGVGVRLFFW